MQVILLEKIRNLGGLGDEVKVKPGYARNYLIPYGKAVPATPENRAKFEARRAELEQAQREALERAKARAAQLQGYTIQIVRRLTEEGRLFGSVTARDICEAAQAAGFALEKSEVHLPTGPIKDVGDHAVQVTLHPEVSFRIIVSVVGEKEG
jgi:large subunit ribosomal protein L9